MSTIKEKVPVWRLLLLSASGGACDLGYAIEASYALPVLQGVGISLKFATILLALSPIFGMLLQPFLGAFSDQCKSSCGRRKPLILSFSVMAIIGCGAPFMTYFTDLGLDIIFIQVMVVLLVALFDFGIGQLQLPSRAFLLDVIPVSQSQTANFIFSLMIMICATFGFALGAVPWSQAFGDTFTIEQQAQVVFGLGGFVMLMSLISTLLSIKEPPYEEQPHDQGGRDLSLKDVGGNRTKELASCEIDTEEGHKELPLKSMVSLEMNDVSSTLTENHVEVSSATAFDNEVKHDNNVNNQFIGGSNHHSLSECCHNECSDTFVNVLPDTESSPTDTHPDKKENDTSFCNVTLSNQNESSSLSAPHLEMEHDQDSRPQVNNNQSKDYGNIDKDNKNDHKVTINEEDMLHLVKTVQEATDGDKDDNVLSLTAEVLSCDDTVEILSVQSTTRTSHCVCCKPSNIIGILRTTLIDTLSFIYHMSLSMWIVWFVVFFAFFGDFAFANTFTTFVGIIVFGGDPEADVDSDQYQLFTKGVRMGSLVLTVSTVFGGILSLTLTSISKRIRMKTIFLVCLALSVVALFLMTVFQDFYFIMATGLFYGPYLSITVSVPFAFIPIYEKKGLLFRKMWPKAPDVIEGKACGVLYAAMFSGQIIASLVVGPVVELAGDENYLVIVPCIAITVAFMISVFIRS